jgi:hypothetical protein
MASPLEMGSGAMSTSKYRDRPVSSVVMAVSEKSRRAPVAASIAGVRARERARANLSEWPRRVSSGPSPSSQKQSPGEPRRSHSRA